MQDEEQVAKFRQRAGRVRTIAKGIFDKAERKALLKFVADAEKLYSRGGKPGMNET